MADNLPVNNDFFVPTTAIESGTLCKIVANKTVALCLTTDTDDDVSGIFMASRAAGGPPTGIPVLTAEGYKVDVHCTGTVAAGERVSLSNVTDGYVQTSAPGSKGVGECVVGGTNTLISILFDGAEAAAGSGETLADAYVAGGGNGGTNNKLGTPAAGMVPALGLRAASPAGKVISLTDITDVERGFLGLLGDVATFGGGTGFDVQMVAPDGTVDDGLDALVTAGDAFAGSDGNGGNVILTPGALDGTGDRGFVKADNLKINRRPNGAHQIASDNARGLLVGSGLFDTASTSLLFLIDQTVFGEAVASFATNGAEYAFISEVSGAFFAGVHIENLVAFGSPMIRGDATDGFISFTSDGVGPLWGGTGFTAKQNGVTPVSSFVLLTVNDVVEAAFLPGRMELTGVIKESVGALLNVAANTIAPTAMTHHVGAGLIKTITPPFTGFTGTLTFIPDAAFTYDNTGNIAVAAGAGLAIVDKPMTGNFDGAKWYMSY